MNQTDNLEKHLLLDRIIWGAIFASLGLYVFTGLLIQNEVKPEVSPILLTVFYLIGVSLFLVIITIRNIMLRPEGVAGAQPERVHVLARYRSANIVSWVLAESVGVFGLVAHFLGFEDIHFSILILISAYYMIRFRPSRSRLESYLRKQHIQPGA